MKYPTSNKSRADYTLRGLEILRGETITWAKSERVFDKILVIGRELAATVVPSRFDNYRIGVYEAHDQSLPLSPIVVVYREYTGRLFSQIAGTIWESIEQVIVYLGPVGATLESVSGRDGSGNPKFYLGLQVMNYQKSSHPTGNEKQFIAPGRWVDILLSQYDQAEAERKNAVLAAENAARDKLYYEMLLDKDL